METREFGKSVREVSPMGYVGMGLRLAHGPDFGSCPTPLQTSRNKGIDIGGSLPIVSAGDL